MIAPSMYGPGDEYYINSLKPYTVDTEFTANTVNNLTHIKTHLVQGFNYIPLEL